MTTFLHSFRELLDFGRVITKNLLDLRHFFIYRILKNTNWVMYITKNFFFWTHGTNWERSITRTVCKDIRISEILNIWTFRWPLDRVVCFFLPHVGKGVIHFSATCDSFETLNKARDKSPSFFDRLCSTSLSFKSAPKIIGPGRLISPRRQPN